MAGLRLARLCAAFVLVMGTLPASTVPCPARLALPPVVSTVSADDNAVRQPAPVSRRNLMGVVTAAAAGTAALSQPSPARAFGIGFPGYDLNVEARSRASKRNNNELEEARRRQIEARKKKLAEEAAVAGGQE